MNHNIRRCLYQKLSLQNREISVKELATFCNITNDACLLLITEMVAEGLVNASGAMVKVIPWWDEDHLEIMLDVPSLPIKKFELYCSQIDQLNSDLRAEGYNSLRPYKHETTIEIILGAAAGLVLAEFLKSFIAELSKRLANFACDAVARFRNEGLEEVRITIERRSSTGGSSLFIQIRGSDAQAINEHLTSIIDGVLAQGAKDGGSEDIKLNGSNWSATVTHR